MASLECSNCKDGIYYHDFPDGTEYVVFREESWKEIIESDMDTSLYICDVKEQDYTLWRCKKCGTFHAFEGLDIYVKAVYKPIRKKHIGNLVGEKYIVLSDLEWDPIVESGVPGKDIEKEFPDRKCLEILVTGKYAVITNKPYKGLKTWYELLEREEKED